MSYSRQRFVAAAAAAYASIGFVRTPAQAADFSWKLSHDKRADEPMGLRAAEAAQRVKAESGGRMEILVFPLNALGGDTAVMGQLRSGAVQMQIASNGILANVVPIAAMENVAFAFSSYKQAFDAMDGPFGANIRTAIAAAGLHPLENIWVSGFKQITTSGKQITVPDDLRGLKIRVPPRRSRSR